MESAVGARLFEPFPHRIRTNGGRRRNDRARDHNGQVGHEFERRVAGRDVKPTGELSVTTAEAIGQHFMPEIVAQFQAQNPGIAVELILSNQSLNLSRRDADIAIRLTNDPQESLVGRRICTVRWGVYCRRDLIGELGSAATD